MSKMDNLRAMREARYEQAQARAGQGTTTRKKPAPLPSPTPPRVAAGELPEADASEALCGHRAISGRTCTREAGHAAKSHRYA